MDYRKPSNNSSQGVNKPPNQPNANNNNNIDANVRNLMSELVRQYAQRSEFAKLKTILLEHRNFIDDILSSIDKA